MLSALTQIRSDQLFINSQFVFFSLSRFLETSWWRSWIFFRFQFWIKRKKNHFRDLILVLKHYNHDLQYDHFVWHEIAVWCDCLRDFACDLSSSIRSSSLWFFESHFVSHSFFEYFIRLPTLTQNHFARNSILMPYQSVNVLWHKFWTYDVWIYFITSVHLHIILLNDLNYYSWLWFGSNWLIFDHCVEVNSNNPKEEIDVKMDCVTLDDDTSNMDELTDEYGSFFSRKAQREIGRREKIFLQLFHQHLSSDLRSISCQLLNKQYQPRSVPGHTYIMPSLCECSKSVNKMKMRKK